MNLKKLHSYFSRYFDLVKSSNGWYRFTDPFDFNHSDTALGVNFNYGVVKDFRNEESYSIINFIKKYEGKPYKEIVSTVNQLPELDFDKPSFNLNTQDVVMPKEFRSLVFDNYVMSKRARNYLLGRGFDIDDLDYKGFGYAYENDWSGYILIPVKRKGKLCYYFGRSFIGSDLRYKNPKGLNSKKIIYNEDALFLNKEVNMLEGWSDAETLGNNSIATLSWQISQDQYSIIINSPCRFINIIADKGYYKEALKNALPLVDYKRVKVIGLDNFGDKKDVNDIGKEIVQDLIAQAQYETYESIFRKL